MVGSLPKLLIKQLLAVRSLLEQVVVALFVVGLHLQLRIVRVAVSVVNLVI